MSSWEDYLFPLYLCVIWDSNLIQRRLYKNLNISKIMMNKAIRCSSCLFSRMQIVNSKSKRFFSLEKLRNTNEFLKAAFKTRSHLSVQLTNYFAQCRKYDFWGPWYENWEVWSIEKYSITAHGHKDLPKFKKLQSLNYLELSTL